MALKGTIIGNDRICRILDRSYASGKLAHAYLFDGPDHVGKKTLALNFCRMILHGFGQESEKNPDLMVIKPFEDKKEIVVDQIRELEKNLSFSPYSSEYKIAIIEQAEKMNREASNALLKTLEEPSKTTILILITSDSSRVLETVRSRCQVMKFLPVKKEELRSYFGKRTADDAELENLIEIAGYKPGKVIELLENKDLKNELIREIAYLSQIGKEGDLERLEKAEAVSGYSAGRVVNLLDVWMFSFRKKIISRYAKNGKSDIADIRSTVEKMNLIKKTKDDILTKNVNLRLSLENLILYL